jgi:LacI family transcriptional regulator
MIQAIDTPSPVLREPLLAAALCYIERHAERPVQVPDVADAVGVTRRTLERRFRSALRTTVYQQITRAHVNRAKRLLATTDAPVGAVARAAGFTSVERMAKVFRRVERLTPSQYRRSVRLAVDVDIPAVV